MINGVEQKYEYCKPLQISKFIQSNQIKGERKNVTLLKG